ncbi:hypothetical protein BX616_005239, partial [Lobosporangium transversale]
MAAPTLKLHWKMLIDQDRNGAAYFIGLESIHHATPINYFEYRGMEFDNQIAIVSEWRNWMSTFCGCEHKALQDLGRKPHNEGNAALEHLATKVLKGRKLDMLTISREQLRQNEIEMSQSLKNAPRLASSEELRKTALEAFDDEQREGDKVELPKELAAGASCVVKRSQHTEHPAIEKRLRVRAGIDENPSSSSASRTQSLSTMPNPFLSEDDAWQDFAYFTSFGQASTWTYGADGPDAIDYLSLFKEYRTAQKTSLALDMVADVSTSGSESGTFMEWIRKKYGYAGLRNARYRAPTSTAIKDIWPTFDTVVERIFAPDVVSYDDVCRSVVIEPDQLDPLVTYCSAVLRSYMHHFTFSSTVRKDINEREAFVDFTWCFIRSALTIAKIPSRMLEVQMDGSKDRKVETKQKGTRQNTPRRVDGVGLYNDNQIYIAEAGQVYGATLEKKEEDAWKVKRAMRDSWVSQLRRICETHRPTSPLVVFGSTSHLHTTKFYAMDFVGCFRVSVLSSMVVPLSSDDFADKMKA